MTQNDCLTGKFYVMLIGMNTSCFHAHDLSSWLSFFFKEHIFFVHTSVT